MMRKAMSIGTLGLSGLVFKDDSKKERAGKHPADMNGARTMKASGVAKASATGTGARKQTTAKKTTAKATKPRTTARAKTKAKAQTKRAQQPQTTNGAMAAPKATSASSTSASSGTASELERLAYLHRGGALTNQEFAAAKAKILAMSPGFQGIGASATFPAVEANVAAARHLADIAEEGQGASIGSRERH